MDPVLNPFAPGAGTPPPELAGRDELREMIRVAIERVRRGLPTKSILMVGLRGVGKGMIWSPSHGDTAFTVPLFDEFMRRIMPGDDWRR